MKKIISLFVIATMIFGAMSLTASANDVASFADFVLDGTVNKLTADINAGNTLAVDVGQSLTVDLNGYTWANEHIVLDIIGGDSVVKIYDSSAAKTGKIDSGNDAITISNGTLTLENITVDGGAGGSDAIFAQGGNITVKGCTLVAGKAGLDSANGSASAGVPVVATISDTKFAASSDGDGRNCAIELRSYTADQKITLTGNNVFETNMIMLRNYTGAVETVIAGGEGATVSFGPSTNFAGNDEYKYHEITYSYEGGAGETPDTPDTPADPETPDNPATGDAFIVVALTVAAVAFAGVVVSKKVRA